MKRLTCEMCGSTDLIKDGGVFVCQSCGTKYSVEEAKKMMIEGTVEVAGTVKVDNTDKIENYLHMAKSALDSTNNKEAEEYCNRIIEMDVDNYKAWLYKGEAAGWQSTLANLRLDETVNCFEKAIENAPIEEVNTVARQSYHTLNHLILAVKKLKLDNVSKFPDKKGWQEYLQLNISMILKPISIIQALNKRIHAYNEGKPEQEQMKVAELQDTTALQAEENEFRASIKIWNEAYDEYSKDDDGHPSDYALERMMAKGAVAYQMMDGIALRKGRYPVEQLQLSKRACKEAITMHTTYRGLQSYKMEFSSVGKYYKSSKSLTSQSQQWHTDKIRELEEKSAALDKEIEQKQAEEAKKYWDAHPEEKAKLEQEKNTLIEECTPLRQHIAQLSQEVTQKKEEIEALKNQKKSLGLFKGKEKAALQAQIDALEETLAQMEQKKEEEANQINAQLAPKEKRIQKINETLASPEK